MPDPTPARAPAAHPAATAPVRVLPVPGDHSYVRHLEHPDVPGVVQLEHPGARPGPAWEAPAALDAAWVGEHAEAFDVLHLHFGFDASTPAELSALVASLRAAGRPLVYTAHDLRNPHHRDRAAHDAQLDVLVPAADAVITLTPGAAAEIARRWGRTAVVVPHPHVVPDDVLERPRPPHDGFVVGLHLKGLRANVAALDVVTALQDAVRDLPGARLRIDLHEEVLDPAFPRHDAALLEHLRAAHADGSLELRVHGRFTDDELWDHLLGLDLSVMPYAFGTHSGWAEACHDLGTAVLAPAAGYWAQQQELFTYPLVDGLADRPALAAAVHEAHRRAAERSRDGAREGEERARVAAERRAQRREVAAAHEEVYRALLGAGRAVRGGAA